LKITTSRWLTPSGKSINDNGVVPDIEVSLPDYAMLPYVNPDLELKENMLSDSIKVIEEMLSVLGYTTGDIDGLFDETTKNAVIQFQKDHELEETGVVQGATTRAIMQKLSEKINEED